MSPGSTEDRFDLARFLDAQAPVYAQVLAELGAARKRSHWMWFIFPQLKGLGRSSTALFYGLASREEALAYWMHAVLGARLQECARLLLQAPRGMGALQIMGSPDDLKLRSCMTLFATVAPQEPVFKAVLQRYFDGRPDTKTLELLAAAAPPDTGTA